MNARLLEREQIYCFRVTVNVLEVDFGYVTMTHWHTEMINKFCLIILAYISNDYSSILFFIFFCHIPHPFAVMKI